jgi:hypothetical protein
MTKTKRALAATAITAAATAIALVPATAQAHHVQPREAVTTVSGLANFTQLPTHDRVNVDVSGVADDGAGTFQISNDNGTASGKVVCVTGSNATADFSDAAIGLHINRSTISGLARGTDAIEYVRDGGRGNPDGSGLVTGDHAICPDAGFTIPDGVLVQVPDNGDDGSNNGFGNGDDRGDNGGFGDGHDRFDRHHRYHRGFDGNGFRVQTRG